MRGKTSTPIIVARAIAVGVVLLLASLSIWSYLFPHCIVEGTWVDTPNGRCHIEDLRVGDEIRSRGPAESYRTGKVMRSISALAFGYLRIHFSDGGDLCVTGAHPVWTTGGWVLAEKLGPGMVLDGPKGPKTILSIEPEPSWVWVYDLEVAPDPNFVASGVLVHNKSTDIGWLYSLRVIVAAEAYLRENDADRNTTKGYWVGDVAGLYNWKSKDGKSLPLIERSFALADIASLEDLSHICERHSWKGYFFATIPLKADGTPYDDGSHHNASEYAFCSFPANREAGGETTIVNESGVLYRKNISKPTRIMKWPNNLDAEGWIKVD